MRKPSERDISVELEGVGTFVYGQRTMGDFLKIRRRYLELSADSDDEFISRISSMIAVHEVMCVSAPEEWKDLEKIQMDEEAIRRLIELEAKLGEAEDSFRKAQV